MQMQIVSKPSMLCKDIYELEKDFRYNLSLLKLRDAEIERCKMENIKLLHNLQLKDQEITHLHTSIHSLENCILKANAEKTNMEHQYQETVSKLWENLSELKRTHENYKNVQVMQTKKHEMELKRTCTNITRVNEAKHQQRMSEMNTVLEREMCSVQKLKTKIQTLMNENMTLRTQYQDKHSYYASKFSILESELKTTNDQKTKLQTELTDLKKESADFKTKFINALSEVNRLKQESLEFMKKSEISEKKIKEILEENQKLNSQLHTNTNELRTYSMNLQRVQHERDELKTKCEHLENKILENKCTRSDHQNIDVILKQNSVLQEVVKSLRKERSENQEIEIKVRKLEDLIAHLKASMMTEVNGNVI